MTGPAGALWPYRFVCGVTSTLLDSDKYPNFTLETNTPAESVTVSGLSDYPYEVGTPRGRILAKHVIHCTNGYAGHLLPGLRDILFPLRGQMTLQSPPPSFPRVGDKKSWILHYAPGFDYITQSPSPSSEIYLGGGLLQALLSRHIEEEDIDIGSVRDDQQSEEPLKFLERAMEERFKYGKGATIINKWTGVMGYTVDAVPLVGKVPKSISGRGSGTENGSEWIAAGFCGHGMAYCWLTGRAMADMVLKGEENVGDWFPREQLACSEERLRQANMEEALAAFMQTVA